MKWNKMKWTRIKRKKGKKHRFHRRHCRTTNENGKASVLPLNSMAFPLAEIIHIPFRQYLPIHCWIGIKAHTAQHQHDRPDDKTGRENRTRPRQTANSKVEFNLVWQMVTIILFFIAIAFMIYEILTSGLMICLIIKWIHKYKRNDDESQWLDLWRIFRFRQLENFRHKLARRIAVWFVLDECVLDECVRVWESENTVRVELMRNGLGWDWQSDDSYPIEVDHKFCPTLPIVSMMKILFTSLQPH